MYQSGYKTIKTLADQIVASAQETGKTPERKIAVRQGLMEGIQRARQEISNPEKSQEQVMAEYMRTVSGGFPEDYVEVIQAGPNTPRPVARGDVPGQRSLESDREFMSELQNLKQQYPGLTDREIFLVIQGESSFNPTAESGAGARGLFQIMPEPARESGINYDNLLSMSPAQQLREYSKYLERWGYDGSQSLGILQGAPGYRNASADTVVYEVGSPQWEQNKGWRTSDNGPVTVGSINAYYRLR